MSSEKEFIPLSQRPPQEKVRVYRQLDLEVMRLTAKEVAEFPGKLDMFTASYIHIGNWDTAGKFLMDTVSEYREGVRADEAFEDGIVCFALSQTQPGFEGHKPSRDGVEKYLQKRDVRALERFRELLGDEKQLEAERQRLLKKYPKAK